MVSKTSDMALRYQYIRLDVVRNVAHLHTYAWGECCKTYGAIGVCIIQVVEVVRLGV